MVICCWSVKGGSGTSVVAACLALLAAGRDRDVVILDLAGDQAAILGVDRAGPGVGDWLRAGEEVALDALARLEVEVSDGLRLIPAGRIGRDVDPARVAVALELVNRRDRVTLVDLGTVDRRRAAVLERADRSILVVRPCYLALRRARSLPPGPEPCVVLVAEPGRALDGRDVAHALGVDSVVRVPWEPAVARAVDAGTLTSRLPSAVRRLAGVL